ncbi:MAG: metal ABC transporter substrate-binding protein [Oscillospiraceae bacterium]|nr:metal ABC transporter substrate-binding protein [Oscillospiraceae bacterium]
MKRLLLFFLITTAFLCIASGCEPTQSPKIDGQIHIIATVFPVYDFARNIAGDRAEVSMLLPPSSDSHHYDPSPRDIIRIQECDIFLYIGGASDEWTEQVFSDSDNLTAVKLFDSVTLAEQEHSHGANDLYDEHIWTSPRNAVLMTRAILAALCAADSGNAEFYEENAENYIKELEVLDRLFTDIISEAKRDTVIFADRFPFRYFCEAYMLTSFAAFPGCSEESEPSAQTMAFLIEKIRNENIPVVFYGELSDKKTAASISRETGAETLLLHSCHTVSQSEMDSGISYVELMKQNAENLKRALY